MATKPPTQQVHIYFMQPVWYSQESCATRETQLQTAAGTEKLSTVQQSKGREISKQEPSPARRMQNKRTSHLLASKESDFSINVAFV